MRYVDFASKWIFYVYILICLLLFLGSFNKQGEKKREVKVRLDVYQEALESYKRDTGEYPSSSEGLNSLIFKPKYKNNWNGPYLNYLVILKDSWGNEYRYIKVSENEFMLYSIGENRIDEFGKGDDLTR